MIILQHKTVKISPAKKIKGTFKVLCALSLIALKTSIFQVSAMDTSSSDEDCTSSSSEEDYSNSSSDIDSLNYEEALAEVLSYNPRNFSKGGTFISRHEEKFTGNVDDFIRQAQSRNQNTPVDLSKMYRNAIFDNATVESNGLSLANCTMQYGLIIAARIVKGDMLYEGTVYPTGSRFKDGKCVYNPSAPKG